MSFVYTTVPKAVFSHRENTEKPALIAEGEKILYRTLEHRVELVAKRFLSLGVAKSDRVLYSAKPSAAFVYTLLAAAEIGAVAVGVAYRATEEACAAMVEQTSPRAIVCADELYEKFRAVTPRDVPIVAASELLPEEGAYADLTPALDAAKEAVVPEDPFLILFTSGTTKKPKGAVLTHKSALAAAHMQNAHLFPPHGFTVCDTIPECLPVNHVSGCMECTVSPLVGGGSVILLPDFDPASMLDAVERYRATVLCGVPAMWVKLFEELDKRPRDLSSLRLCVSGASPLPAPLAARVASIATYFENPLGMTELCGMCTFYPSDVPLAARRTSVGCPMPEIAWKIAAPDGTPVEKGQIGEICYRGDSVIATYTSEPLPRDAEGYFKSGDLALVGEDGLLHLSGRTDDMFVVGGYNVFPQEIEDALTRIPGVTGAAVLPIPHHTMGKVPRAYLTVSAPLSEDDIRATLEKELIYYKVPRNYVFLEAFPRNALGKICKTTLAKEIEKEFSEVTV